MCRYCKARSSLRMGLWAPRFPMLVCRSLQLGRGGPDTQGSFDGSQFGPMRSRRRRRMAPTRPKQVVPAKGRRPDSIDPVVPMSTRGSRRRSPRWPTCRPCRSRTTLWLLWSVVDRTADQKRSDNGVIFAVRRGGGQAWVFTMARAPTSPIICPGRGRGQ